MIYIVTLLAILVCVVAFDFGRINNPRLKKICYASIFIWLTALAGFSYNVGSDIPGYMRQYAEIGRHHFETWKDFAYFENRQPGWMLLNIICSRIWNRFVLLQLIIAIFSNFVILRFIKGHTKYVFSGIFLYYVCFYLNYNFNTLRQTLSIVFVLIGYDSLVDKKWLRYYFWCCCAFMFHTTAAICFLFPFFYLIRINTKWLIVSMSLVVVVAFFAIRMGGADFVSDLVLQNAELASLIADNADQLAETYFGDNAKEYGKLNLFGLAAMLIYSMPIILVIIGASRKTINLPHISNSLLLFYLILYFMDFVIPVVFMRFLMYLDIIYICALADLAIEFPKKLPYPKNLVTLFIICIALFRPVKTLIEINPSSNLPFYKQFVPYYSVFDPQRDPVRAKYFGFYNEE